MEEVFKLIPVFINMEIDFKKKYGVKFGGGAQLGGDVVAEVEKKVTDTEKQLIALVQSWLSLIFIVLSKTEDVPYDYKMKKIGEAIMNLSDYLKKTGNTTISLGKS